MNIHQSLLLDATIQSSASHPPVECISSEPDSGLKDHLEDQRIADEGAVFRSSQFPVAKKKTPDMIPATYCMSINSAVWDSTAKLSYANANCIV